MTNINTQEIDYSVQDTRPSEDIIGIQYCWCQILGTCHERRQRKLFLLLDLSQVFQAKSDRTATMILYTIIKYVHGGFVNKSCQIKFYTSRTANTQVSSQRCTSPQDGCAGRNPFYLMNECKLPHSFNVKHMFQLFLTS